MRSTAAVLVRLAFANILSSALNVFIGLVLMFGAALLVVGGALFSTLDESLSRSIVDSITGHIQVYGGRSKDPLEIYGKVDGSDSNLAPLDDFKTLKAKLLALPNVARVVPMGGATALVGSGNTVDVTLERLRALYRNQRDEAKRLPPDVFAAKTQSLQRHVRNIVAVVTTDVEREKELTDGSAIDPAARTALATASTEEFWKTFDEDPLARLELLENRIAPLVADADLLFLRCLGTDLDAYQASFSRMVIVEGTPVPKGHRGVLLPRFFVEELFKLKNARRLDKLREARQSGRRLDDATDKELQRFVRENRAQTREIELQLDGEDTATAITKLQKHLGSTQPALGPLLSEFFAVTEENFDQRYRFFYAELAPMLSLYRAKPGDMLTLRSFGRSGATQTAVVKVYGIFELHGLEKSPLAGANALVDMLTFRELYGYLSAEKKAELDAMKAEVHAKQIARDDVEAALFGEGAVAEQETTSAKIDVVPSGHVRAPQRDTFGEEEIDDGVVLHAAVVLKDGSDFQQRATLQAIEQLLASTKPAVDPATLSAAKNLVDTGRLPSALSNAVVQTLTAEELRAKGRAPLSDVTLLGLQQALKLERPSLEPQDIAVVQALLEHARPAVWAVDWGSAAGFLGKFIDFFRLLLGALVSAFAFVALMVVTLGMTIATLQRTQLIGTMRAIGAQRSFVVGMVMVETIVLALTFGTAGAALGAGVVKYLHFRGIPAFRDELYFFFSGPVLRPELTLGVIALALGVTLVVSLLAVIFPTYLATRVAPVRAMQPTE